MSGYPNPGEQRYGVRKARTLDAGEAVKIAPVDGELVRAFIHHAPGTCSYCDALREQARRDVEVVVDDWLPDCTRDAFWGFSTEESK